TGLKSFHSSLAGRNDIGGRIAELLKGDTDSFSITNVSSRATIPSVKSIPASVKSSGSANFTESFKLSISPSVFTASGNNTQTITISAVSEKAVNGEVYLAIGNDDECRIFRLSSSDKTGKKFGGKLIFTSQDIGVIKALCFAHNSGGTGTSLNISNIACTVSLEDANSSSLKITTVASLPTVSRRQAYSVALKADGTVTLWSIVNGELPAGLSLNASTGKISGTPTVAGTYKFTSLAENDGGYDAKEFTVKVTQTTLTGDIPANTTRRATYTGTPKVSGGASPYVWTISTGKLPDGLKINASTGKITGNPTKTGTFKFTVKAKDKNGAASTKAYTLKVTQTTLTGDIPANTTRRASYTGTPKVSGGASPYVWTISTGKLPDGLKINASTGKITGSATKAGTFKFTVKAKDKNGAASTKQYTVKVTQTTLTGDIPASTTRRATFTGTPKASGGASPYVWSIGAGKLPDGLKLNSSTGKITGVASKAGTFTFTVKAKDKNGAAGTKAYTVKVTQTKVTGTLANAVKGSSYTATPKASNGASPYVWSVSSGNLPTGLKLNSSTGKISGTPSKTGSYTFTIKAKDKNGAAGTKSFTVKVTASASAAKSSLIERTSTTHDTVGISAKEHSTVSALPATTAITATESGGITSIILPASLHVVSNDILESHDGKDSDIITVKAGKPLTFVLGDWGVNVSGVTVCVDDKPAEGISISPEGVFTFPAEWVYDDFRVSVKATYEGSEIESEELYITSQD
ncbi:MAG: putative Ig domain-containing protein, partial [Synergistaceae bacterium]|nr:putative Ig domain-containing protein [Synergistaceae bacterium]